MGLLILLIFINYFSFYLENTEIIQQLVGGDVKLQCDLKGLVDEQTLTNKKVQWFFKHCGDSSMDFKSCHSQEDNEWTALPCDNKYFCKSILTLHNVTEKYSGLYKCSVNPFQYDENNELNVQLVRTYQLEIKSKLKKLSLFFLF